MARVSGNLEDKMHVGNLMNCY